MRYFKQLFFLCLLAAAVPVMAIDHPGITTSDLGADAFTLIQQGTPTTIIVDDKDNPAVQIAVKNLQEDFRRVCGQAATVTDNAERQTKTTPATIHEQRAIIIGSLQSTLIQRLVKRRKLDGKALKGKREKYVMQTVERPLPGIGEALVIAGSDRRGTVYGIYELSEQLGVSPWYWWADVPVAHHRNLAIQHGTYTAGEPRVRYRGIFLNDEAPCLTSWVKNTFDTDYGGHRFYARVCELLLRLRANFLWPAMWGWSFYADDPQNSATADSMGIIMGTSHHEPMARNHQEWARHRKDYGAWDYVTNRATLDRFFREGMERARGTEDLITIGMRGDGDTAMGAKEGHDNELTGDADHRNMQILSDVIANQRRIIADVTGRPAKERPQVWALYKEVQRYYDMGLRVPDDVTILLSDDNWGNIRWLPSQKERQRSGGWGMYYHVDYCGAPRNTKWINVTPIQNLWEQMKLTADHGVDRLWILNVGDLKPMEYPIALFLDMAWNPDRYTASNLLDHTRAFFAQQLGERYAGEAARIMNLYSKYAGRITPEMLCDTTYNLHTGEWQQVAGDFARLEADALSQYASVQAPQRDAYKQLILFPVQAMSNLYDMYYAQAMNHWLYQQGKAEADEWADRVARDFRRDSLLCADYNHHISQGKWNGMMTQKHIGYTTWNDNFPADRMPEVKRFVTSDKMTSSEGQLNNGSISSSNGSSTIDSLRMAQRLKGGLTFRHDDGRVVMEAEHFYQKQDAKAAQWTIIPDMGRTLSAITLQPTTADPTGGALTYRFTLPDTVKRVTVHVILRSTLASLRHEGHRFTISLDGDTAKTVNFNGDLNEAPENIYRITYPTVASRIIDAMVALDIKEQRATAMKGHEHTLTLRPLDPDILFEKIIVDYGGYEQSYLFGKESSTLSH